MKLDSLPRVQLSFEPTPLQKLRRLAEYLGLNQIYLKRDDQTGLGLGGNKARKLEYLLADALQREANIVLTVGGPQSNHCRITAAAARACGLECTLIFRGHPIEQAQGSMIIDRLLKAKWIFAKDQTREEKMDEMAKEYLEQGLKPYLIPAGGSNALGTAGYVRAGLELARQCQEQGINPDYICCASGSGGTQAGLILGCHLGGLRARVIGISVSRSVAELTEKINMLLVELGAMLDVDVSALHPVQVSDDFVGDGYGRPTKLSQTALELCAALEGVILDPVYTAKGLGGLMAMVENGRIPKSSSVIFIHTGGMPALFADTELYWPSSGPLKAEKGSLGS